MERYVFTKEQEDKIYNLHKSGMSLLDIGKEFGVGYKPIQRILVRNYGVVFKMEPAKIGDIVNGWQIIDIQMRSNFKRSGRNDRVAIVKSVVEGCERENEYILTALTKGTVPSPDNNKKIVPHNKSHGESKSRLYKIWSGMINRCRHSEAERFNGTTYQNYKVQYCKEWSKYEVFREWALSSGYQEDLSIDRIDFKGNYEPSNCKWSDRKAQTRNRSKTNHLELTAFGETRSIFDWIDDDRCSISIQCLRYRLKQGWPVEKAIIEPSGSQVKIRTKISTWLKESYPEIYDQYFKDYYFDEGKYKLSK